MNNVWKRALSLALSGVLLVGSLPLNALATEETVPSTEPAVVETQPVQLAAETQPVQTEPAQTEPAQTEPPATEPPATEATQPAATQPAAVPQETVSLSATDSVKNSETPALMINGEAYADGAVPGVAFSNNVLTLTNTAEATEKKLVKIEAKKMSLVINLVGKNEINAGNAVAIDVEEALTIQGSGSLKVETANATAISVKGYVDSAATKHGLVIDGVTVSVKTTFEATPPDTTVAVGIASANGVVIKGNAHFKTNATKSGEKYVMEKAGYINGAESVANAKPTIDGKALEYVAGEHFDAETWRSDVNKHYKSCKGECVIAVRRDEGSHTGGTADCMNKAVCSGCGLEYDEVDYTNHTEHTAADTKYIEENDEHLLVHTACGQAEIPGTTPTHCTLEYTCEAGSSEIICACNTEGCPNSTVVFKVEAPAAADLVWDNTDKKATIKDHPELGEAYTLTYYKDSVAEENKLNEGVFPKDPGTYIAVATVKLECVDEPFVPQTEMIITAAQIQGMTVSLDKEKAVFEGLNMNVQAPTVTVQHESQTLTKDTHYTVEYHTAEGQVANLSEIGTYTIKIIGKAPYVTGTVEKQFRIVKKPVSADDFTFAPPAMPEGSSELVYDGTAKTASVTHSDIPADKITVKYFKGTEQITQPVDAGDYTVTISVAETNDYAATETDLSSPNWKFTIKKAGYTIEAPQSPQKLALKNARFTEPNVKGVGTDDVGEFKYTINYLEGANGISYESAVAKLASISQEPQNGVEIKYTFQRQDENYNDNTDQNTGSFVVELSEVKFYVGEDIATKDNAVTKNKENIFVGDTDLFTLKTITAKHGNDQKTEAFSIKLEPETPVVGNGNAYVVLFTGTVDGVVCKDMEVCRGTFEVKEAPPVYTAPTAKKVPAGEDKQDLVQAGTTDRGTIRYSRNNTEWKTTIPQEKDAGAYWVYWQIVDANDNTKVLVEGGKLTAVIYPVLTATYGDTLDKVNLPDDWSWHLDAGKVESETTVGNAGAHEKYQYTLDYNVGKDSAQYPTVTELELPMTIAPKKITPTVSLNDSDGYIHIDKMMDKGNIKVMLGTEELKPDVDYKITTSALTDRTEVYYTVQAADKGNYTFEFKDTENEETTASKKISAKLYREAHSKLTETNFPEDDLSGAKYDSLSEVKSALSSKIKANDYPESKMEYFSVYMTKKSGNNWIEYRSDGAFPTDGIEYEIPYSDIGTDLDKSDSFKVAIMDTAGDNAGEEAKVVTPTKTDKGLKISLKEYAAVCVAVKIDIAKEYTISKSIVLDGSTSTKGSLTIQVNSKTATKATYGTTVKVTAKANSGYSIEKVMVTTASGTAVTLDKKSEGNYEFKMPADNVTVKLSLKKTTTSTKNPNSGDSSNIQLWVTILAASAVAIAALMVFWFRKRRK